MSQRKRIAKAAVIALDAAQRGYHTVEELLFLESIRAEEACKAEATFLRERTAQAKKVARAQAMVEKLEKQIRRTMLKQAEYADSIRSMS
jgi:hypothetical protein